MRVEVARGPRWVVSKSSEADTCVPYIAEIHPDGRVNAGFSDLVRYPEKIDGLPEVQRLPALGELLRWLNGPESEWLSTACDAAVIPFPKSATHHLGGGLVYVIRRRISDNLSDSRLIEYAKELAAALPLEGDFTVGFEVRPLDHLYGYADCWALKVKFLAVSVDPGAAMSMASSALPHILQAFQDSARSREAPRGDAASAAYAPKG